MLNKILLFVNYNFYDSKRYFVQKLSQAFHRQGILTKIIDTPSLDQQFFLDLSEFGPDLTCTFNRVNPLKDGSFFWDHLGIPHFSILVDPAFDYLDLTRSPYTIISCVDRGDVNFLQYYHFDRSFFWPHAVERELCASENMERIYDVVFMGSFLNYEGLREYWKQRLPHEQQKVLDDASEIILSDKEVPLLDALTESWNDAHLPFDNAAFSQLFHYLDLYTRGKDRMELVRSIRNASLHIFGDTGETYPGSSKGWSSYLSEHPNIIVHPGVSFAECLNIIKQSKICLNSMPFFKDGTHERIFVSLACGAVPISTQSKYIKENFLDGEEIVLYRSGSWNHVDSIIQELLQNETKRREIASRGRAKVMRDHTWDRRVEQFLEIAPSFLQKIKKAEVYE